MSELDRIVEGIVAIFVIIIFLGIIIPELMKTTGINIPLLNLSLLILILGIVISILKEFFK